MTTLYDLYANSAEFARFDPLGRGKKRSEAEAMAAQERRRKRNRNLRRAGYAVAGIGALGGAGYLGRKQLGSLLSRVPGSGKVTGAASKVRSGIANRYTDQFTDAVTNSSSKRRLKYGAIARDVIGGGAAAAGAGAAGLAGYRAGKSYLAERRRRKQEQQG